MNGMTVESSGGRLRQTALLAPDVRLGSVTVRTWVWPASIVVLGAVLRLYRLGAWDLTYDEAFGAGVAAAQPLTAIWTFVAREDPYHPPLSHIVLHFWRFFGSSEFTLRLFSVILGTLSIWLIYRIGAYLLDRRTGILAAGILAVSPFHVWYSQEARMYPLLFFLSLISLDALARLMREDRTSQWLVYVGATTLSLYADYGAFLLLAAQNIAIGALIIFKRGPRPVKWVLAQSAIVLFFLPWAPVLVGTFPHLGPMPLGESLQGGQIPAPTRVQHVAWVFATFTSAFLPRGQPLIKIAVILLFGAVFLTGLWATRRRPLPWSLLSSIALIPIALGAILSYRTHVLFPRTLIPASAGYYLILAAGFLALPPRRIGTLLLTALVGVNLLSLSLMYHRTEKSPPWSTIAHHVSSQIQPGEGIVFLDAKWRLPFDLYYRGPEGVDADGIDQDYVRPGDVERVQHFAVQHQILYLVLYEDMKTNFARRVRRYIQSRFTLTARTEFPMGVAVERYRK